MPVWWMSYNLFPPITKATKKSNSYQYVLVSFAFVPDACQQKICMNRAKAGAGVLALNASLKQRNVVPSKFEVGTQD